MKKMCCLFLGIALSLVGAVGCVEETPVLAKEISDYMKVSKIMQKEVSQNVQEIDKASDSENSRVYVRQTFGNEREMYILFEVTFAEGIDIRVEEDESILPQVLTLSDRKAVNVMVCQTSAEDQSITYLSYFDCSLSQWPPGDLVFSVGQFAKSDPGEMVLVTTDIHEICWSPTNQGTVLQKDILSETGDVIGYVSLSQFSLRFALDSSAQADFSDLLLTIDIVDNNGEAIGKRGPSGVSGEVNPLTDISGKIIFREVLDLSTVATVQIDGYTVIF